MDAKGNEDYLVSLNVTPMVSLGVRRDTMAQMPKNTFPVPATLTNWHCGRKVYNDPLYVLFSQLSCYKEPYSVCHYKS